MPLAPQVALGGEQAEHGREQHDQRQRTGSRGVALAGGRRRTRRPGRRRARAPRPATSQPAMRERREQPAQRRARRRRGAGSAMPAPREHRSPAQQRARSCGRHRERIHRVTWRASGSRRRGTGRGRVPRKRPARAGAGQAPRQLGAARRLRCCGSSASSAGRLGSRKARGATPIQSMKTQSGTSASDLARREVAERRGSRPW